MTRARSRKLRLAIPLVLLALVLLLPMVFGAGLLWHSACVGTPLGTESIWTPGVVVNSPPNGSARGWGNGSDVGGDWGTPVLENGSAGVVEVELNWTVSETGMAWVAGPGQRDACAGPYRAAAAPVASGSANGTWCPLQGPGTASDVGLSTDTPVPGCPFLGTAQAATFNDSFVPVCAGQSASQGGCGAMVYDNGAGVRVSFRESVIDLPVGIPIPGRPAGAILLVSDPIAQTMVSSISDPGCWVYEVGSAQNGQSPGLQTWGPHWPASTPGTAPGCSGG